MELDDDSEKEISTETTAIPIRNSYDLQEK